MKSTDAGAVVERLVDREEQEVATGWQRAGGDRDWSYGEVALGLAVAPNDANTVAFTDLGFIHISNDGGAAGGASRPTRNCKILHPPRL